MRFGPASNAYELLALHDEMRQAPGCYGQPLGQAIGVIAGCHAAAYDQARSVRLRLFQDERPGGLILAAGQSPGKNEAALDLALRHEKNVPSSGKCREYAPYSDVLVLGQDAFGAAMAAVIDEVVCVPSGAAGAHLGQPRPDVTRRAMNCDSVIDGSQGLGNQIVSGKRPGFLTRSGVDLHAGINSKGHKDYQYPRKYDQGVFPHETTEYNGAQVNLAVTEITSRGAGQHRCNAALESW